MNGPGDIVKKVLLASAALAAAALVSSLPVLRLGWPAWSGVLVFIGVTGVGAGAGPLWRWRAARRQKAAASDDVRQALVNLKDRWTEGLARLRASRLSEGGDAVDGLPWVLMLGETGSGKTAALAGARLATAFDAVSATDEAGPTRQIDWRLFDRSVVIDTAGRYTSPVKPAQDDAEWRALLRHLVGVGRKDPLNGAVVAVSGKRLMEETGDRLESLGKSVRRRIDELMRSFGVKVPVYLLITQADALPGLSAFVRDWPMPLRERALGRRNADPSARAGDFFERAFLSIAHVLKEARLLIPPGADPVALTLPESILGRLRAGASAFARAAFGENPYQETPWLRGVFLAAADPSGDRDLFLKEFFGKIIPEDRALAVPTHRSRRWGDLRRRAAVAAWFAVLAGVAGLLTHSFLSNMRLLRSVAHEFAAPPVLQGDLVADILTLNRFDEALTALESRNQVSWLSQFGLREGRHVELKFKSLLSRQFRTGFLTPFDERFGRALMSEKWASDDATLAQAVGHLLWRLRQTRGHLQGTTIDESGWTLPRLPGVTERILLSEETAQRLGRLYIHALRWSDDDSAVRREQAQLQSWLEFLIKRHGLALGWVKRWFAAETATLPVGADDWGGKPTSDEVLLPALHTRAGRAELESRLNVLRSALPDPAAFEAPHDNLVRAIQTERWEAWRRYLREFPAGARRLSSREDWRRAAGRIAADDGPFFAVLKRAALELGDGDDAPAWVQALRRFHSIRALSVPGVGVLAKLATDPVAKDGADDQRSRVAAAAALADYRATVTKISALASGDVGLADLAAPAFQADGASAFTAAFRALEKLKAGLAQADALPAEIVPILAGPVDFLWEAARRAAGAKLQSQWEETVLPEAAGLTGPQALSTLLAPEGPVFRFVKGPGAPFIQWRPSQGYRPREAFGRTLAFREGFFQFLNAGVKASQITLQRRTVDITSTAPQVNENAERHPYGTRLELKGEGKSQVLDHNTVWWARPKNQSFTWDGTCGDVVMEIRVGDLRLVKTYPGTFGFFKFLEDFRSGRRVFRAEDFPEQTAALKRLRISQLTVRYDIRGASDAPAGGIANPGRLPERIIP
jgi:type VI secretion system protein ImpL